MRTSPAFAPAMAPRTWRWYATSRSIWCAKPQTNDQSSGAASAPRTIPNIYSKSWARSGVNLDSVPCLLQQRQRAGILPHRLIVFRAAPLGIHGHICAVDAAMERRGNEARRAVDVTTG